jgi:anti-sigma-K factor RskA
MNYQHPSLLDELAAQYVLGTLRGLARQRFERIVESNPMALMAVQRWEDRFVGLLLTVSPVEPPALLWNRIRLRIRREKPTHRVWSHWNAARFALAAGIATLAVAIGWWNGFGPGSRDLIATVVDQQQTSLWRIDASKDRDALHVAATADLALDPNRAYELWALPAENAPPVSLGLLPRSGRETLPLNDAQRLALSRSAQIAISLEPPGGSPTGAPTGPVLYVAELIG